MTDKNNNHLQVMVIEDEELLLDAITYKLTHNKFDVKSFTSGIQAILFLTETETLPDLIWLDYYLKDINGLEFIKRIKNFPRLTNIPVLVVSNSATPDKVHAMLALGVEKYILKAEHRLDEVIEIIHQMINK